MAEYDHGMLFKVGAYHVDMALINLIIAAFPQD
jgi:hypothetical protein